MLPVNLNIMYNMKNGDSFLDFFQLFDWCFKKKRKIKGKGQYQHFFWYVKGTA